LKVYGDLLERFFEKVQKTNNCWEWTAATDHEGYGRIWVNGKPQNAHRTAYELFIGPIPKGKCILHHCDNPACVNPRHLFLGTQMENITDKTIKNRQTRGEQVPTAKLTRHQVQQIRKQYRPWSHKFGSQALGRRYGVSDVTILMIINGVTWKEADRND